MNSALLEKSKFFLFLYLFVLGSEAYAFKSQEEIAASDPSWLSFYQYRQNILGHFKSEITSQQFFISDIQKSSPLEELKSADKEFSNPQKKYGTLQLLAPCAFPARKLILEKLLNKKYPQTICPDVDDWLSRINANQASVIFAGAYSGNSASILGHTFLRFYNKQNNTDGKKLLSYTVAYSALTDPKDNKLLYALKGIMGDYPGYYDIEPLYIKVGVYNNSESRDLWEYELNLSPEQVQFYLKYIWELTFNAQFRYYFFDYNCSYRLLATLNVVLDRVDLTEDLPLVVIPTDTLHLLRRKKFISNNGIFRASLQRKLTHKLKLLDSQAQVQYEKSKTSMTDLKLLQDPTALDALMDYWLIKNYQQKTHLADKDEKLFEETFNQAASVKAESKFQFSDLELQEQDHLISPTAGHATSWTTLNFYQKQNQIAGQLEYRMGVHPYWQKEAGYDGVAGVEYLGLKIDQTPQKEILWNILLLKALSLEDFNLESLTPSWKFDFGFANTDLSFRKEHEFYLNAGAGIAKKYDFFESYLFLQFKNINFVSSHLESMIYPGVSLGFKFIMMEQFTLNAEANNFQVHGKNISDNLIQLTYFINKNTALGIKSSNPGFFISAFF